MPARSGDDPSRHDVPVGTRLTVAGAAARLGVAASTLRTWERRYGLGPSARTAGRHRRYDAADVARLQVMRRLTRQGVAPADAALLARGQEAEHEPIAAPDTGTGGSPGSPGAAGEEALDPLSLAAAAVEGDDVRLRRMIARAVPGREVTHGWQTLISPALDLLETPGRSDLPGRDPVWALGSTFLTHIRSLTYPETTTELVLIHTDPGRLLQAHVLAAELMLRGHPARVVRPHRDGTAPQLTPRMCQDADLVVLLGPPEHATETTHEIESLCPLFVICLTDSEQEFTHLPSARTLAGAVHEIDALLQQQ